MPPKWWRRLRNIDDEVVAFKNFLFVCNSGVAGVWPIEPDASLIGPWLCVRFHIASIDLQMSWVDLCVQLPARNWMCSVNNRRNRGCCINVVEKESLEKYLLIEKLIENSEAYQMNSYECLMREIWVFQHSKVIILVSYVQRRFVTSLQLLICVRLIASVTLGFFIWFNLSW